MNRREFIGLLGGTAAAWPFAAQAQQSASEKAMPVIGYLGGPSPQDAPLRFAGLSQGLKEAGFVEGQNIAIDYRAVEDRYDQFREFAFGLVDRHVDLIFAFDKPAVAAARAATKTTPIVFAAGGDPVIMRLVASAMRPGANVTGVNFLFAGVVTKQFELLRQVAPNARVVAVLINQANANAVADTTELQRAADRVGSQLLILNAGNQRQLDAALASIIDRKAEALLVEGDPFFSDRQNTLVAWAAAHGIPAIYADLENAAAGGLMTYGVSVAEAFRMAGVTIGRILKGEKPGDLAVQQSNKTEFVIDLKTAKALGLVVPQTLLAAADKAIE